MKEAIGQTFIINLILLFFGILVLLLFGSINYSKAYKTKNRLITIIEKYGEYPDSSEPSEESEEIREEIRENMVKSGYQTTTDYNSLVKKCKKDGHIDDSDEQMILYPTTEDFSANRNYEYCIIKKDATVGEYYQVIVYMKFDIPLLGGFLSFPVMGETKPLYTNIDAQ